MALTPITGVMAAHEAAADYFTGKGKVFDVLDIPPGPSRFYFAWCDEEDGFDGSMLREDELIFSFDLQHDEGQFCELTIEIANPYTGLLAPDRKLWAWFSWNDGGTNVTPLFFGRIVAIPDDLFAEIIKIKLVAKSSDYAARQIELAKTLKVLPHYDPIFIDATKDKENDPNTVLEAYSALWHVDRVTNAVTMSDIITGEDGIIAFSQDDVFYDSVKMTLSGAPLLMCEIEASVQWTQCQPGTVDTKTVPGLVGDPKVAPGVTMTQGVTSPADDFKWAKDQVQVTNTDEYKNPSPGPHQDGDLMEQMDESTDPMYGGAITSDSKSFTHADPETGQGEESKEKTAYVTTDYYTPARQTQTPGYPVPNQPANPNTAPAQAVAEVSQNRVEDIYIAVRADVQPVLASLTLDQKDLTESLSINSRDLVEVKVLTVYSSVYFATPRGQQSIQYLLLIARAHLLAKSRVVSVEWECPFATLVNMNPSCRKNATIDDPRLPGSIVNGKIVSYGMSGDGDTGKFVGKVNINSTVGNYTETTRDAGVRAITASGTPDYVEEGYVELGYQHYTGALVATDFGDLSWEPIPYTATGIQFPLTVDQLFLRHEYHDTGTPEGRAIINSMLVSGSNALKNFDFREPPPPPPPPPGSTTMATSPTLPTLPASPSASTPPLASRLLEYGNMKVTLDQNLNQAIYDNLSWVEMELAPMRDLWVRQQHTINTTPLRVPKQIDLAAS